jgi:hypothetical protein
MGKIQDFESKEDENGGDKSGEARTRGLTNHWKKAAANKYSVFCYYCGSIIENGRRPTTQTT